MSRGREGRGFGSSELCTAGRGDRGWRPRRGELPRLRTCLSGSPPSSSPTPFSRPLSSSPLSSRESGFPRLFCFHRTPQVEGRSWDRDSGSPARPLQPRSCSDCFVVSLWNFCRIPIFDFFFFYKYKTQAGAPRPFLATDVCG